MQSFASQAKEQADYAFNRIPDSHWNSLLGTGVDKDHFGQSLPCVTQADLSVMEHRYYPKRDERSCSDLEFALNRLLPDVESTAADAKRKINHQVAVFNREYGIEPHRSRSGWTCRTTGLYFPAFIPGWKRPDTVENGSRHLKYPHSQVRSGRDHDQEVFTVDGSVYGTESQGSDVEAEDERDESSEDEVVYQGRSRKPRVERPQVIETRSDSSEDEEGKNGGGVSVTESGSESGTDV